MANPQMLALRGSRWLPVLLLLAVTLLVRLYHLDAPLFDYHTFRQTETASIAKNFYLNGYRILHPQLNDAGPLPVDVASEFPVYSYLVALLYGVFGLHELLGRLLSVAFAGGTAVLLYRLLVRLENREVAFYATLFFALSPYGIYFTRTFMPESSMLFFSIAALLTFQRWLERGRLLEFGLASAAAALMILAKLPAIHVGVPILFLAIRWYGWRVLFQFRLWAYAAIALVPAVGWYMHAWQLGHTTTVSFAVFSAASPAGWMLVFDPGFYSLIADWLIRNVLTIPGLGLAALGIVGLTQSEQRGFYLSWLSAVAIYFVVGASGLVQNDYYVLPAVLSLAPLVGVGARLVRGASTTIAARGLGVWNVATSPPVSGRHKMVKLAGPAATLLIFGLLFWQSAVRLGPLYSLATQTMAAGNAVDRLLPQDATVVAAGAGVPEVLYAAKRHGWVLFRDKFSLAAVSDLSRKGAAYFLTIDREWMLARSDFLDVVRRYPVAAATQDFLLLKLASSSGTDDTAHLQDFNAQFSDKISLTGWGVLGDPARDATIRLSLRWAALNLHGEDLRYSVRLLDGDGSVFAQRDTAPLGGFFPTGAWQPGEVVNDYVEVPLRAGTPPGQYDLQIRIYDGKSGNILPGILSQGGAANVSVTIGTINRQPFLATGSLDIPKTFAGTLSNNEVRLLSAAPALSVVQSGASLAVDLLWQAVAVPKGNYVCYLELRNGDRRTVAVEERRVGGNHATSDWRAGELVLDRALLRVGPKILAGSYDLVVRLTWPDGTSRSVNLGPVHVEVPFRRYEVPPPQAELAKRFSQGAELLGYDIEGVGMQSDVSVFPNQAGYHVLLEPGRAVTFTLHWRAFSEMETSYTVFVQVLDRANHVVAQHDGLPALAEDNGHGQRPTTSWIAGEIILDQHQLTLPASLMNGEYLIIAGLYDAETGQRLSTEDGSDYVALGIGIIRQP